MVRAKAVDHPSQWLGGAFDEHTGRRKRYCIIDRERLLHCLDCASIEQFRDWYYTTLELYTGGYMEREPYWTEAAAVGSREWNDKLTDSLPLNTYELEQAATTGVDENQGTYVVRMSNRKREGLLSAIG